MGVAVGFGDSAPEQCFGVDEVRVDSGGTVASGAVIGAWNQVDGRVTAGSLGVLVDAVIGWAIIVADERDRWSVSNGDRDRHRR